MLLGWCGYLSLVSLLLWDTLQSVDLYDEKLDEPELQAILSSSLRSRCIETHIDEYRMNFAICFMNGVVLNQYSFETANNLPIETNTWNFVQNEDVSLSEQRYIKYHNCEDENGIHFNQSQVVVKMECCHNFVPQQKYHYFLSPSARNDHSTHFYGDTNMIEIADDVTVREVINSGCETYITVCSKLICKANSTASSPISSNLHTVTDNSNIINSELLEKQDPWSLGNMSSKEQSIELEKVYDVFNHAYQSYMQHAFPKGELRPISCEGGNFDLIKIPLVTLIDALDMLVIVQDFDEFRRAIALIVEQLPNGFDFDVNVSVFETTIRLLGGLLSAHMFAIDPQLQIYPLYRPRVPYYINSLSSTRASNRDQLFEHPLLSKESIEYKDELLILAMDLGNRLLSAFNTKTGIPYGTVNLRQGVPKGETKISSTAGAGSLFMEFHVLSILADDAKYGHAAHKATRGLYDRRSALNLVGKHINIDSGQWQETMSGVGSNSDSFYEYSLKAYAMLHGAKLAYQSYELLYQAVKKYILPDDTWFAEVDMFSGRFSRSRIENLDAFWPGLEVAMGEMSSSARQLQALYSIWLDLGFLPEELDVASWRAGKGPSNSLYPLRPELIEATVYHYQATKDRSWLTAGKHILESIQNFTRTGCGFASVANVLSIELSDEMPSFFLSETVKYLYLLFDEDNFLHNKPVIYTTEAHPFDLVQLRRIEKQHIQARNSHASSLYIDDHMPHEDIFTLRPTPGNDHNNNDINNDNKPISPINHQPHPSLKPRSTLSPKKRRQLSKQSKQQQQQLQFSDSSTKKGGMKTTHPSSELTCTIVKWWEVPRSFQWTTEDITVVSHHNSRKSSSSSHRASSGRNYASRSSHFAGEPNINHNSKLHSFTVLKEQRIHRRKERQEKSLRLLQHLIVQYYDIYSISPEERPEQVRSIMQLLSLETISDERENNASMNEKVDEEEEKERKTTKTTSQKTLNSVPTKPLLRPLKCRINGEDEITASLQSLENQLLDLKNHPNKDLVEKMKEFAKWNEQFVPASPSALANEQPLKSVDLVLGNLGAFTVQVFSDAFRIIRQLDAWTIDVANVGRKSIFVRQLTPIVSGNYPVQDGKKASSPAGIKDYEVAATASNLKGFVTSCFVDLIQRNLDEDPKTAAPEVLLRLPCATSSFSRNRPRIVEADLSLPTAQYDVHLCTKSVSVSNTVAQKVSLQNPPEAKSTSPTRTALDDIVNIRQWFRSRFTAATTTTNNKIPTYHGSTPHDHHQHESPVTVLQPSELAGSIVLADRGQCLFEDKAQLADQAGAVGLIVKNNENSFFVMAGKKETELDLRIVLDANVETMDLPVVMLTDKHANKLLSTFRHHHALLDTASVEKGTEKPVLKVRIVNEEMSSLLLSPVFGVHDSPKVWSSKQSIFVQTKSRWGAFFQATTVTTSATNANTKAKPPPSPHPQPIQQEWQMYLVDMKDYQTQQLVPPLQMKTPQGHKLTTPTATLMLSPGDLYRYHIKRTCPSDLLTVNPENKRDVRVHRKRTEGFWI